MVSFDVEIINISLVNHVQYLVTKAYLVMFLPEISNLSEIRLQLTYFNFNVFVIKLMSEFKLNSWQEKIFEGSPIICIK